VLAMELPTYYISFDEVILKVVNAVLRPTINYPKGPLEPLRRSVNFY